LNFIKSDNDAQARLQALARFFVPRVADTLFFTMLPSEQVIIDDLLQLQPFKRFRFRRFKTLSSPRVMILFASVADVEDAIFASFFDKPRLSSSASRSTPSARLQ
jgi:hypothetical protein